jgi:sterol desaturase/sphingolipid hydroxylase (fatty acid hydroxylase superfamily)
MAEYAAILMVAIPIFILLTLIEYAISIKMKMQVVKSLDTISSLSSGMTNTIKSVLGLAVGIISYEWMLKTFAIVTFEASFIHYFIAFVTLDFAGYWSHRWEHVVNIFWNRHIIHHSSEEFNLACALRQNISAIFLIFTFLLLPAALLGVPAEVIGVVAPLHLFAQFWYHTRLINRMGFLENILVTPSHHRVHHAINDIYIDKNYSQIFIIWDKWFGTFQEELENEPPVYGVKKPVLTFNPIIINYQHFWQLLKDAYRTQNWIEKLILWFKPTGYRPADVAQKYPISIIEDPYSYQKYEPQAKFSHHIWAWLNLVIALILMLHLFSIIAEFPLSNLILYGFFLFVTIFGYTSLMDFKNHFIFTGVLRLIILLIHQIKFETWFGINFILMYTLVIITLVIDWYVYKKNGNQFTSPVFQP